MHKTWVVNKIIFYIRVGTFYYDTYNYTAITYIYFRKRIQILEYYTVRKLLIKMFKKN